MEDRRENAVRLRIAILQANLFILSTVASAQVGNSWSFTGSMAVPRAYHKAVLLSDGKVLVSGGARYVNGTDIYLSSCEIYDPTAGTWTTTDSLGIGRYFHTMTLLKDGRVLVAGGAYASGNTFVQLNTCEIYDPVSGRWSETNPMNYARSGHTATLLPDGRVLVVGGNLSTSPTSDTYLNSAEIYDPTTSKWSIADSMSVPRSGHSATLLPNGTVLVAGGHYAIAYPNIVDLSSCEIYNPSTSYWSTTDSMAVPHTGQAVVPLLDGRVLLAGGEYRVNDCEIFNPQVMEWSETDSLLTGRDSHSLTLLPNGKVLAVGVQSPSTICEVYNPAKASWTYTDSLPYDISDHGAVLLNNGEVLISGGYSYREGGYLSNCLLFNYKMGTSVKEKSPQPPENDLLSVSPNPINSDAVIRYTLSIPSHVQVEVYDVLGRLDRTLADGFESPGDHSILWSSELSADRRLSSGLYICCMRIDGRIAGSVKVLLMR
jgi:N-acetylneuraminic acid mutarotase